MFNDARTSLEIRPASDTAWKRRPLPVFMIVALIVGVAAYLLGKYTAEVHWQSAVEALEVLEDEYTVILEKNSRLQESFEFEKAKSLRDLQIKRQAYDEIVQTLKVTSNEIASLRESIRFYESIIEGNDHEQGLQIKRLSLSTEGNTGEYQYKLIITNNDYSKKKSRAKLLIEIEGIEKGELKKNGIATGKAGQQQDLTFKYLKRVEGQFFLPDEFDPQRLLVTVKLTGSKAVKKEKWYDWDTLIYRNIPEKIESVSGIVN